MICIFSLKIDSSIDHRPRDSLMILISLSDIILLNRVALASQADCFILTSNYDATFDRNVV